APATTGVGPGGPAGAPAGAPASGTGPTVPPPAGGPAATAAAGGGGAASVGPASPAPPTAGTYRYATQGQSTIGATVLPFPAVTTLVIDPASGTRQRAVRDLRSGGTGPVFEYVLDYRPEGIHLVSLSATTSFLLFAQREELRPPSPLLLVPAGAAAGARREADVPTASGATARLAVEVRGPATVTAGGRSLATTVVHLTATLAGELASRIDQTVWLADGTGVWARERLVAEATAPTGEVAFRSEYTATLQE
ncbi:MAG TPA: hypothetical protein VM390_03580, partial [Acidimicrobiales bacterium]|nr:hypothetical protein [Acidimicrobiales bacterium]